MDESVFRVSSYSNLIFSFVLPCKMNKLTINNYHINVLKCNNSDHIHISHYVGKYALRT